MWKNIETLEIIDDEEMEHIVQSFPCYIGDMGRLITCQGESWTYEEGDVDVLYY